MQRGWKKSAHITIASGSSGISFSVTEIAGLVMRSARFATAIRAEGVAFILERGHENNAEVRHSFSGSTAASQTGGSSGVSLLPCQTRFSRNPAGGFVFVLFAQERHKPSAG